MTEIIEDIRSTYARLIRNEGEAARALTRARADLETAREADIEAYAESALAGEEPPKRKEVRLRHTIENLEVAARGYDRAFALLQEDAIAAVQGGRRELDPHEQHRLREHIFPQLTDAQRRHSWAVTGQVAPAGLRPDDIVAFVEAAFDYADLQHDGKEEARRRKEGYDIAIRHIQQAKSEHTRRGKDMQTFTMDQYTEIVTAEDLTFLTKQPGRGAFQNQSKPGQEVPWPGSVQDLRENSEPQATPA
jgi:hypothetical protein